MSYLSSFDAESLGEEAVVSITLFLETASDIELFGKDSQKAISDLARKTILGTARGEIEIKTAGLFLKSLATAVNVGAVYAGPRGVKTGGISDTADLAENFADAVCGALPQGGEVSRELYQALCYPTLPEGDFVEQLLLAKGVKAQHSWPQATELLRSESELGKIFRGFQYIPAEKCFADKAYNSWAGALEAMPEELRSASVYMASQTAAKGAAAVLAAREVLGPKAPEDLPMDAVVPGRLVLSPYDEVVAAGESLLTWIEGPENFTRAGYPLVLRNTLNRVMLIATGIDEELFPKHNSNATQYLPPFEQWNFVAANWAARIVLICAKQQQHEALIMEEAGFAAEQLAGRRLGRGRRRAGAELAEARARALTAELTSPFDDITLKLLARYCFGAMHAAAEGAQPGGHLICTILPQLPGLGNQGDYDKWSQRLAGLSPELLRNFIGQVTAALWMGPSSAAGAVFSFFPGLKAQRARPSERLVEPAFFRPS